MRTMRILTVGVVALAVTLSAASAVPASAATATSTAIRKVDFRNFTYTGLDDGPVRVVGGEYLRDDPDDTLFVQVLDVDHGDIDGDGVEEAVVHLLSNTGGTGQFTDGRVFELVGGKAVEVASLGIGDRADQGIDDIVIVNGVLRVERYEPSATSGACCPDLLVGSSFRLRGTTLVEQGEPVVRRFLRMGTAGEPTVVKFLAGTSEAVLEGEGSTVAVFDAAKGQRVTLTVRQRSTSTARVVLSGPSLTAKSVTTTATVTLAASGRHTLAVRGATSATARVTLTIK